MDNLVKTIEFTIQRGYLDVLKLLIDHVDTINHIEFMEAAIFSRNFDIFKYLIDIGFDIHKHREAILGYFGDLSIDCDEFFQMIKILASNGVNVLDAQIFGISMYNDELFTFLLDQGANLDELLLSATEYNRVDRIKKLLELGADANANNGLPLQNTFGHLQDRNRIITHILEIVNLLLDYGAHISPSQLENIDKYKDEDAVKSLVERIQEKAN